MGLKRGRLVLSLLPNLCRYLGHKLRKLAACIYTFPSLRDVPNLDRLTQMKNYISTKMARR